MPHAAPKRRALWPWAAKPYRRGPAAAPAGPGESIALDDEAQALGGESLGGSMEPRLVSVDLAADNRPR
jgi:hypothetical protein